MNPFVETNLALILFLPWFLILGALYWIYPRQPRTTGRRLFDIGALLVALVAFVISEYWAFGWADPGYGKMWQQVVVTSVGYGVFLLVMLIAVVLRRRWWPGIAGRRA